MRKRREIQNLVISSLKKAVVLASFSVLYGLQVVPNIIWGCQVVNGGGVPGGPQVLPGGCLVVIWPKTNVYKMFEKGCFWPPGEGLGDPLYVILRNLTPSGALLMRKVLEDDNPA